MNPLSAFELLFFAIFGQTTYGELRVTSRQGQPPLRPQWTDNLFKVLFGLYMLVSVVVLINLLIAMMSDTYQRIQVILFAFVTFQYLSTRCTFSNCCFSRSSGKRKRTRYESNNGRKSNLSGLKSSLRSLLEYICWFPW